MSDNNQSSQKGWTSTQVYTLSAICLLVGVIMGYLFRASTAPQASTAASPAAMQTQPVPGNPAGNLSSTSTQPSSDDMKRMADKQVAPLLEQLKSNPNDDDALMKVAHYYAVAGQFKDAASYYEKASEVKPNADVLTLLGNAYYYGGAGDKALDALNRAVKIDPNSANALFNLGMLKWQVRNDPQGAIDCWERLLKANPNHPRRAEVEEMIARAKRHSKIPPGTKTNKPAM